MRIRNAAVLCCKTLNLTQGILVKQYSKSCSCWWVQTSGLLVFPALCGRFKGVCVLIRSEHTCSPTQIWKERERERERSVFKCCLLHFRQLYVRSCFAGVFTQTTGWGVKYPDHPVCAVRGFNVSLPCSYSYPQTNQVTELRWCSMNSNKNSNCIYGTYVYDSLLNTSSDFQYAGDNKSDCTLSIRNVQFNDSGVYKFRFITNLDKWTGNPGVTLQVSGKCDVVLFNLLTRPNSVCGVRHYIDTFICDEQDEILLK